MASVNKAIIIGNLGRDPELRFTQSGQPVATFTVATSDRWTDKATGQPQEKTEWHRIVVWGKAAEHCGQYLKKGRSVYIEGRIQTREWTNKENQKQWTTEIIANQVTFLGGRPDGGRGDEFAPAPSDFDALRTTGGGASAPGDDDIPF